MQEFRLSAVYRLSIVQKPSIGRIVIYRSRTGNYDVPAIITATVDTLADIGVEMWHETDGKQGVPPLSSEVNVHLNVQTPGIPGLRAEAQDFKTESPHGRAENIGGVYQEWDVWPSEPFGDGGEPTPGSWRWPERV